MQLICYKIQNLQSDKQGAAASALWLMRQLPAKSYCNPKISACDRSVLANQAQENLILFFGNILCHCQCFINIKIYIITVLVSYDTFALAFCQQRNRFGSHDGCIDTILAGR